MSIPPTSDPHITAAQRGLLGTVGPARRKSSSPRPDEIEPLIENLIFSPLGGCGGLIGYASIEFHRLPPRLVLAGWPVFRAPAGEIQVGLPLVLGAFPGARHTAISSTELTRLVDEARTALLAHHPDLIRGS